MTTKAKKSPTYSSLLATCVSASRNAGLTNKTVTKFVDKNDEILTVWSFENEPHAVALGQRALIRTCRMPDGKLFHNLE
jgi:hypothetical protein